MSGAKTSAMHTLSSLILIANRGCLYVDFEDKQEAEVQEVRWCTHITELIIGRTGIQIQACAETITQMCHFPEG